VLCNPKQGRCARCGGNYVRHIIEWEHGTPKPYCCACFEVFVKELLEMYREAAEATEVAGPSPPFCNARARTLAH